MITTRPGTGTFVAGGTPKLSASVRRERMNRLIDDLFTEAYHLGWKEESLADLIHERAKRFQLGGNPRQQQ